MNINVTLLFYLGIFCLGIAFLASNGFAENLHKPDLQKRLLGADENTEGSILKKTDVRSNINDQQVKPSQRPVYTPPFLGAPSANRLIGMAVRGIDHEDLLLSVLTPEHTGLTSHAQPVFYWYLSKPVPKSYQFIEFVLSSDKSTTPVLRTRLDKPSKGGIQKIPLADYNISLIPEVEYRWSIALVSDANARSLDIVSSGNVKLAKPNKVLETSLQAVSIAQHPAIFAQAGLWYEAMTSLVNQVEKQPENLTHTQNLAALLEQAGLQEIVTHMNNNAISMGIVDKQK
ncbi:MAG: DUF928 domain-containing protein [Methylococcales bacterium]